MTEYFRCDPESMCRDAKCCRSVETNPTLSVGDFFRLSEYTGTPITDLWREVGNIGLTNVNAEGFNSGDYAILLSLIHDPCPYLDNDFSCAVYEVRPLGCSSFPLLFDAGDWETYGHYPCLKGRQIDPEDLKMGERIRQIMREESKTDLEVFWNERRNVIGFKNTSDFFVLAEKVLEFQRKADPEGMDPRTRRFGGAVIRMRNMIRTGRINDGITSDMFAYLASSVMFPTYGEAITERFEQLSGRIPGLYDDTSERYKKILEELAEKDS